MMVSAGRRRARPETRRRPTVEEIEAARLVQHMPLSQEIGPSMRVGLRDARVTLTGTAVVLHDVDPYRLEFVTVERTDGTPAEASEYHVVMVGRCKEGGPDEVAFTLMTEDAVPPDAREVAARAAARLREVLPSFRDPRHHADHDHVALVHDLERLAGE
jgi:hypothetical protein